MNRTDQATASKRNMKWTALLSFTAMLLVLGATFARYQINNEYELPLEYQEPFLQTYLLNANRDAEGNLITDENGNYLEPSGWTKEETVDGVSVCTLQFLLANSGNATEVCNIEQEVQLQMFASVGIGGIDGATVTLTVDGDSYTATATEVTKDSVLYTKYGPGYKFQFLNGAGQELTWKLASNEFATKEMTLAVTGNVAEDAVVYLFNTVLLEDEEAWAGQLDKVESADNAAEQTLSETVTDTEGIVEGTETSGDATESTDTVRPSGTLEYCPTQYSKEVPISVTAGETGAVILLGYEIFPPMTMYTADGVSTVLSEGGAITLQSGASAEIDLSQTETSGTIVFNTGSGTYSLDEATAPKEASDGTPLVMKEEIFTLPVEYKWGVLSPTLTVKELIVDENGGLSFIESNSFSWKEATDGNIELTSLGADAGTYLVTIDWNDNDITLYSLETTVFLQRDLLD